MQTLQICDFVHDYYTCALCVYTNAVCPVMYISVSCLCVCRKSLNTAAASLVVHKQACKVCGCGQFCQALTNMPCCRDFHQWCPEREYNHVRQVVSPYLHRGNRQTQVGGDMWVGPLAGGACSTGKLDDLFFHFVCCSLYCWVVIWECALCEVAVPLCSSVVFSNVPHVRMVQIVKKYKL